MSQSAIDDCPYNFVPKDRTIDRLAEIARNGQCLHLGISRPSRRDHVSLLLAVEGKCSDSIENCRLNPVTKLRLFAVDGRRRSGQAVKVRYSIASLVPSRLNFQEDLNWSSDILYITPYCAKVKNPRHDRRSFTITTVISEEEARCAIEAKGQILSENDVILDDVHTAVSVYLPPSANTGTKPQQIDFAETSVDNASSSQKDVAVIVALQNEFEPLFLQIFEKLEDSYEHKRSGRRDYMFTHKSQNRHYRCVATFVGKSGNTSSALVAQNVLQKWHPKTIVLLGTAGGFASDAKLGDVVVATQVDDFLADSTATEASSTGGVRFKLSGVVHNLEGRLTRFVQHIPFKHNTNYHDWQKSCATDATVLLKNHYLNLYEKKLIENVPTVITGHLATGPFVSRHEGVGQWLTANKDRKLVGIEMEAGGVLAAILEEFPDGRALIIRGISDFADSSKSDLDNIEQEALKKLAVGNALRFLWLLMNLEALP